MRFTISLLAAAVAMALSVGTAPGDGTYTMTTNAPSATYQWQTAANWAISGNGDPNNAFPGRDANYTDVAMINFGTAGTTVNNVPIIDLQGGTYLLNSLT